MQPVQVIVNGLPQGNVPAGNSLRVELPVGDYQVVISPGLSNDILCGVRIQPGQISRIHVEMGMVGFRAYSV